MRLSILVLAALCGCASTSVLHPHPVVAGLQAELERTRGAVFLEPITVRPETRERYAKTVRKLLAERYPPAVLKRDHAILRAVGLIGAKTDLKAHVTDPAGESVGAYYDPRIREVVLISVDGPSDADRRRFKHELAHALEDQATKLPTRVAKLALPGTDDLDQGVAGSLLNEGVATWLALSARGVGPTRSALEQGLSLGRSRPVLKSGPLLLRRLPRDHYDLGALCVHDLLKAGSWPAFERLARGRLTAEQVLHPDKLGEAPVAVSIPTLPFPLGWSLVGQDTLGEYYLRLLLEELAGRPLDSACADWGGDRLAVYREEEQLAFVWRLDWDTAAAAERFTSALGEHRRASRSRAMQQAQVTRRGKRVLILGGVPEEGRAAVAKAAWGDTGDR